MKEKFKIIESGLFVKNKLTDFKNAYLYYENLKKSKFDNRVKEFFFES